jgi:hypothetical protein
MPRRPLFFWFFTEFRELSRSRCRNRGLRPPLAFSALSQQHGAKTCSLSTTSATGKRANRTVCLPRTVPLAQSGKCRGVLGAEPPSRSTHNSVKNLSFALPLLHRSPQSEEQGGTAELVRLCSWDGYNPSREHGQTSLIVAPKSHVPPRQAIVLIWSQLLSRGNLQNRLHERVPRCIGSRGRPAEACRRGSADA